MNLTELERYLFGMDLSSHRRRPERPRVVNPHCSASPERRAERAKGKSDRASKKARRKQGRR